MHCSCTKSWNAIYFGEKNSAGAVEPAVEIYPRLYAVQIKKLRRNLQFVQPLNRIFLTNEI